MSISGITKTFVRTADSGTLISYSFCPECGATICYQSEDGPGLVAVPLGAFADPNFPAPTVSVYEHRKHRWVEIEDTDHLGEAD